MSHRHFELLGTRVFLCGPTSLLEPLQLVFAWFATGDAATPSDLSFDISAVDGAYEVALSIRGSDARHRLPTEEHVFGFVYARILDEVTRQGRETLCVHGAALSLGGRGIVLAAPSQHGKSTLSLALSSRGFRFLSDEVAAIALDPPTLRPFPMAIGCRQGTFDLLRGSVFETHRFEPFHYSGKMLYDPHADDVPVEAVPLHAVFFLETEDPEVLPHRRYRLWLDPARPGIAATLASLQGVERAESELDGQALRLTLQDGVWAAPAIEAALAAADTMVAGVEDLDAPKPDFSASPRLSRLPVSEATLGLFRHLRGFGAVEELARGSAGGFPELMIDVASRLTGVAFYRLTPGKLSELIERIESVVTA